MDARGYIKAKTLESFFLRDYNQATGENGIYFQFSNYFRFSLSKNDYRIELNEA